MKTENKQIVRQFNSSIFVFDPKTDIKIYAAKYFLKSQIIAQKELSQQIVTMQFFQRTNRAILCGIDEVLSLIKTYAINPYQLHIQALQDGALINAKEPVLKITGIYENFGFLESIIDGILSRRTSVATNSHRILQAAKGTSVFSMADRQDDPLTQKGDGYASYIAGFRKFSTDAQGTLIGIKGMGTMPHALIQLCQGDIVKASKLYHKTFPDEKVTALVDYHNDVITDSLKVARTLNDKLGAVRIDTSISLIDQYFVRINDLRKENYGVCPALVIALRKALDDEGFSFVKIVVSSGFTPAKIKFFLQAKAPVDMFGVGTYLINNMTCGFTGDLVNLNGRPEAKEGRVEIVSRCLQTVVLVD